MRRTALPVHPRLRHPLTGEPLVAVGLRKRDGSPIWPVIGASDDDPKPDPQEDPKPDPKPDPQEDPKPDPADDGKGFPANTAVADMTAEQQAAYWKHQARKHESRTEDWSKLGKTPDEVRKMLEDAKPDSQKALDAAKAEGRAEAQAEANATIVATVVETLLPEGKKTEDFPILEALDLTKFTKDDGTVDTAKVRSAVQSVLGNAGSDEPKPGNTGQGRRGTGKTSAKDAGKAAAERRFGTKQ